MIFTCPLESPQGNNRRVVLFEHGEFEKPIRILSEYDAITLLWNIFDSCTDFEKANIIERMATEVVGD